jgi:hypothetical protein
MRNILVTCLFNPEGVVTGKHSNKVDNNTRKAKQNQGTHSMYE